MKKRIIALLCSMVIAFSGICSIIGAFAAGTAANKFNVVFVLDTSGSMNQTDAVGLRYDALNLFLSLLTEKGNYVGTVLFTQTIDKTSNITEIKTIDDKRKVFDDLKSVTPSSGDTNIGLALAAATDMLDTQRNTNLDSVIILLSDGNTDLSSQKALDASEYYKEYGVGHARSGKYKIYCVGLNTNGAMNGSELQDIADRTDGQFVEVSNPADLSKVTETFYSIIYDTPSDTQRVVIGQDGKVEKKFSVPDIGIEEVNIVVRGNTTGIEITKPDSSKIPETDVENMSLKTNEYTNVKLPNPQNGEWMATILGDPGAEVTISMIQNVDLSIRAEDSNQQQTYKKGDTARISGTIVSKGSDVSDEDVYNSNKAVLKWVNKGNGDEKEIDMQVTNGKYYAELPLDELSTYEGTIELTAGDITKTSNKLVYNVDNTPPQPVQDVVTDKIVLWPFRTAQKSYDLSQYVTDDADTVLKYSVASSSFKDGEVTLDNGIMTVSPSVGVDGTVSVTATDTKGASTAVNFEFNVVSVAKITIIVFSALALIALGILAFFVIKLARMKYYGKLVIQIFDKHTGTMYNRQVHEPYRGKQPIAKLDMSANEVGLTGAFRPKNTGYIIYESKRPFYCSTAPDRTVPLKKIEIALGMSVTISDAEDFLSGANITYM